MLVLTRLDVKSLPLGVQVFPRLCVHKAKQCKIIVIRVYIDTKHEILVKISIFPVTHS